MLKNKSNHLFASAGYGRIRQPGDPVGETCRQIAQMRQYVMDYAQSHDAHIRDENNFLVGMKPGICQREINEITRLFNSLAYSPALQEHMNLLAGMTARDLRDHPSAQATGAHWSTLPEDAKMNSLRVLSKAFVKRINDSAGYPLILNNPDIKKGTLAKGAIMQVTSHRYPGHDLDIQTISISKDYLARYSFDMISPPLWHEHQHVHMAYLREAFEAGDIEPEHKLYEDIRKSVTIAHYGIVANYFLSYEMYRSEPEEKLCHQAQNVFDRVLHYKPQPPAHRMTP